MSGSASMPDQPPTRCLACQVKTATNNANNPHSRRSSSRRYKENAKAREKIIKCNQMRFPEAMPAVMYNIDAVRAVNIPMLSGSRSTRVHSTPKVIGLKRKKPNARSAIPLCVPHRRNAPSMYKPATRYVKWTESRNGKPSKRPPASHKEIPGYFTSTFESYGPKPWLDKNANARST